MTSKKRERKSPDKKESFVRQLINIFVQGCEFYYLLAPIFAILFATIISTGLGVFVIFITLIGYYKLWKRQREKEN